MKIVGRKYEQQILENCLASGRPEFIAVYGRRRVGKTYLIREYFNKNFAFYTTGVAGSNMKRQLKIFHENLLEYGLTTKKVPEDWFEAFGMLRKLLEQPNIRRDPASNRIVVFLDELPWMDTPRAEFKSALDYFWNSWASSNEDLVFIVCGSATSWMIENLMKDTGGLHNRVTRQIHLMPFTLSECEELYAFNGLALTRQQIMESYMVFGGIPYYMNCMDRRLSLAQNIDAICFRETGQLRYEFQQVFASLFRHSEKHINIICALTKTKGGMTRVELAKIRSIGDGQALTKALEELEQCGFIRKYLGYAYGKQTFRFQVTDPFTLFSLRFLQDHQIQSWRSHVGSPGYYTWCGNAFELVCLLHIPQIKAKLGIQGVETTEYSWRSEKSDPGAQIDLVIDRKDEVINICEIKFGNEGYRIDAEYEKQLINKLDVFRKETKVKKALHLTMITANGLIHNAHSGCVINEISDNDLFESR